MSTASYRFGEMIGTALRECMRGANQKTTAALSTAALLSKTTHERIELPEPALSNDECNALSSVPAMVRNKSVDLNAWYSANTRECPQQPAKKPRKRRAAPQAMTSGEAPRLGSLDELIA